MGLLTRLKAAALLCCLLFTSQVFARDYYWAQQPGMQEYGSPGALCEAIGRGTYLDQPTFVRSEVEPVDATYFKCHIWARYPQNVNEPERYMGNQYIQRRGDSCPVGTIDNPAMGTCDADQPPLQAGEKCEDQTGATNGDPMIWDDTISKCAKFTDSKGDAPCAYMASQGGSGTAYTVAGNLDSGGNAVAPPSFADSSISCTVQTISSSECTINVAGAISCNVIGKLTGKANPSGTVDAADAQCPNGQCPQKDPETKTTAEGCSPVGDGSGGSTCTQTKETTQEGTQQCGTVNGAYKCITKQPYSNGITTAIKATSETLPDGSVKVTTVKDSTNTVCTDVKTCTSKTSTTTTTSTTKPNGSTTTNTSCKGSCTSNGGGLETNEGAGSGKPATGNGTGGNGDGEGGDGTADTTDSCAAPPPCDGDPFQCAILKQAHIDTCKLMAAPTAQEKADAQAKTDSAYAALDAHQAQMDSQVSGLLGQFQGATSGGGSGGGKCLPDKQISIAGFTTVNLEFSKTCDSLSWVRLVLLAGAYLIAARIVFREV